MPKKKIRWAIIGVGNIAHQFARDFKFVSDAILVAVASRDINRAAAFAQQYNIKKALSYQELFESEEIDAVYIATTNNTHFMLALNCIYSNKAVLCEKPLTLNFSQCTELTIAAKAKNVFLMEAMWTYFLPAIDKVKEWVSDNRIGNIKMINANFGYQVKFNPEHRLYNSALGGGALLDLGIYTLALTILLLGISPDNIKSASVIGSTNVDETTGIVLTYKSALAVLSTTLLTTTINNAVIYGENGYIEITDFYKANSSILYDSFHKQTEIYVDNRVSLGYHFEIQEVTNCILEGEVESKIMPHSISLALQRIMDEVKKQTGIICF